MADGMRYIVNLAAERTDVVLPVAEYERLLRLHDDLMALVRYMDAPDSAVTDVREWLAERGWASLPS